MGQKQLRGLLQTLSNRLAARGESATLFIVGGAAMALAYDGARTTRDIDAVFEPSQAVREIAAEIAEESRDGLDLSADWINDGAKSFMPQVQHQSRVLLDNPSLRVYVAAPEYLLAMKHHAGRDERDIDDAAQLAVMTGNTTVEKLNDVLAKHYPARLLTARDGYMAYRIVDRISALEPDAQQSTATATLITPTDYDGPTR